MRAVGEARFVSNVGDGTVGILDQPVGVAHAQPPIERGRPSANVLTAQPLELACGEAELAGYRCDSDGSCEVLLHEQQRAAHPGLGDALREWWMGLRLAACAGAIEQQYLARLLCGRAPEMLLDEICRQSPRARTACTGNAGTIREEQPIGDDFLVGKGLEEVLVVIPTHARAATLHEAGAAQDEA